MTVRGSYSCPHPLLQVVHPYAWKASSEYEESDIQQGGYYSVCLDNQFSR